MGRTRDDWCPTNVSLPYELAVLAASLTRLLQVPQHSVKYTPSNVDRSSKYVSKQGQNRTSFARHVNSQYETRHGMSQDKTQMPRLATACTDLRQPRSSRPYSPPCLKKITKKRSMKASILPFASHRIYARSTKLDLPEAQAYTKTSKQRTHLQRKILHIHGSSKPRLHTSWARSTVTHKNTCHRPIFPQTYIEEGLKLAQLTADIAATEPRTLAIYVDIDIDIDIVPYIHLALPSATFLISCTGTSKADNFLLVKD